MKKFLSLFFSLVLGVLVVAGCSSEGEQGGSNENGDTPDSGDEKYTLELAHGGAVDSHLDEAAKKLKELVEEKTDQRVTINIHPNSELGGEREVTESVQSGLVDIAVVSTGPVGNFADKVYALDFPFLFKDRQHAYKVLDGQVGEEINKQLVGVNLKNLYWIENGTSMDFVTNDQPVKKVEDLKGLKLRVQENEIQMDTIEALGATPTPIAFNELFTAAQQGVIDGQVNAYPVLIPNNYYEVHKYISESGLFYSAGMILMNNDFFNGLPEDIQTALLESAQEAGQHEREFVDKMNDEYRKTAEEKGMVITDDIDLEPFKEAVQPVYEKYEDKYGELHKIIRDTE